MLLAQANDTPATFWLDMPLDELRGWIKDSNQIIADRKKKQGR